MANQVTDFRIDVVEIGEAGFYSLPLRVRELIGAYATPLKYMHGGYLRFEMPIQRWDEILPLLSSRDSMMLGKGGGRYLRK